MGLYLEGLFCSFPDAMFTVISIDIPVDGGNELLVRFAFSGTHNAPFGGVPASNKEADLDGKLNLRFQQQSTLIESMVWTWNAAQVVFDLMGIERELPQAAATTADRV